jgi:hypothetical protein
MAGIAAALTNLILKIVGARFHLKKSSLKKPDLQRDDKQSPSFSFKEGLFKVGDWVVHPHFGKGVVLHHSCGTLGDVYRVRFKDRKVYKLVAQYAKLSTAH